MGCWGTCWLPQRWEKKKFSPGLSVKRVGKVKLFREKGLHREKSSPKVESLLLISFLQEEGNSERAARALGRNQQEVAGFVADNTTQKNVQKGQGKTYHLAGWSEGAWTNQVRELAGSLRDIESGPVKQTTQKVGCDGVCPQSGPALRTISDWITGAGKQSKQKRKGSYARLPHCRLEHGPVEK